MPKLNNIDFTSIVRFNGATFESGGGGATILTDWATRLNGTFSEGDTAVWSDTGAVYRWNASLRGGNGDWFGGGFGRGTAWSWWGRGPPRWGVASIRRESTCTE